MRNCRGGGASLIGELSYGSEEKMENEKSSTVKINDRLILVKDCPLCGNRLEQTDIQHGYFHAYACPACGLKWQACVNPNSQAYPNAPHAWMQHLSQD